MIGLFKEGNDHKHRCVQIDNSDISNVGNCWFACDVIAATLVVKNNSLSLLWELNSIFMQIMRKEIALYFPPTCPPCQGVENQEYPLWTHFAVHI